MKRIALHWCCCCLLAFGGTPAALSAPQEVSAQPLRTVKLVRLQHVSSKRVINLLGPTGYSGAIARDGEMLLLSGPPDVIAMIENLIRQIDVAVVKRNIEVQAYMLLGLNEQSDGAGAAKVPAELAGVVKQLKETFPFAAYRPLETMFLRIGEDQGGETSGLMAGPGSAENTWPKAMYQCRFGTARVEDTGGAGSPRRITFTQLRFGAKVPVSAGKEGGHQYADLGANIDSVSVREGQKAVIGKASVGPGKESLFLVLSARIVD